MFYVSSILQLWILTTASYLPLINYRMFNQNLEPNVVIYEHHALPKYLGSHSKFEGRVRFKIGPTKTQGAKDFYLRYFEFISPSLVGSFFNYLLNPTGKFSLISVCFGKDMVNGGLFFPVPKQQTFGLLFFGF